MKRTIGFAAALAAVLCFCGPPALAQQKGPHSFLILNPESRFLRAVKLEGLGEQLRTLAKRYPSLQIRDDPGMQGKLLRIRARCTGSDKMCLSRMAKLAKVDRLLFSEVQKLPGRYLVVMKLVDSARKEIVDQSRQRCGRGLAEIRNALLKGWVEIQGPLIRSQLSVASNVSGADVFLDGNKIGKTPLVLTKDIGRGTHLVEVRHPGYQNALREIKVGGGKLKVALELKKTVVAAAKPSVEEPPGAKRPGEVAGEKLGGGKQDEQPAAAAGGEVAGTKLGHGEHPQNGRPDKPPVALARRPSIERKPQPVAQIEHNTEPVAKEHPQPFLPAGKTEQQAEPASSPLYKQWWFWTAIGVAVAGGVTGLVLGLSPEGGIPSGKGRLAIEFW